MKHEGLNSYQSKDTANLKVFRDKQIDGPKTRCPQSVDAGVQKWFFVIRTFRFTIPNLNVLRKMALENIMGIYEIMVTSKFFIFHNVFSSLSKIYHHDHLSNMFSANTVNSDKSSMKCVTKIPANKTRKLFRDKSRSCDVDL